MKFIATRMAETFTVLVMAGLSAAIVGGCSPMVRDGEPTDRVNSPSTGGPGTDATPDAGIEADSQVGYSYQGCEAGTYLCPNNLTLICALTKIAAENETCEIDDDCLLATLNARCSGFGVCPPFAVALNRVEAAQAAMQAEIDGYCATGTCHMSSVCGSETYSARCIEGACKAVSQ